MRQRKVALTDVEASMVLSLIAGGDGNWWQVVDVDRDLDLWDLIHEKRAARWIEDAASVIRVARPKRRNRRR